MNPVVGVKDQLFPLKTAPQLSCTWILTGAQNQINPILWRQTIKWRGLKTKHHSGTQMSVPSNSLLNWLSTNDDQSQISKQIKQHIVLRCVGHS